MALADSGFETESCAWHPNGLCVCPVAYYPFALADHHGFRGAVAEDIAGARQQEESASTHYEASGNHCVKLAARRTNGSSRKTDERRTSKTMYDP